MKRLPMIAMLIAPYLLIALYMTENIKALPAGLIIFAIVMFLGALYAFFLPRTGCSGNQILFWCMLMKLCNVPIFLSIFMMVLMTLIVIIPLIPFLFLFDCFLLLTTSMYGISGLLKCKKEKRLPAKTVVIHIVLQFIFCADVVSAIYCYIKTRKQPAAKQ